MDGNGLLRAVGLGHGGDADIGALLDFRQRGLGHGKYRDVVGHAHLFGAKIGAERFLTMGNDPMHDLQSFDLPSIDYVALGHIHKHQVLHYANPPVVYAGSIDRVDFGEQEK